VLQHVVGADAGIDTEILREIAQHPAQAFGLADASMSPKRIVPSVGVWSVAMDRIRVDLPARSDPAGRTCRPVRPGRGSSAHARPWIDMTQVPDGKHDMQDMFFACGLVNPGRRQRYRTIVRNDVEPRVGRQSKRLPEMPDEMALIREAVGSGGVGARMAFQHHAARLIQSAQDQVPVRTGAERCTKSLDNCHRS